MIAVIFKAVSISGNPAESLLASRFVTRVNLFTYLSGSQKRKRKLVLEEKEKRKQDRRTRC